MANLLRLSACLFLCVSLNSFGASVSSSLQKISHESSWSHQLCFEEYWSGFLNDPSSCSGSNSSDFSQDNIFYNFIATWNNTGSLDISIIGEDLNQTIRFDDGLNNQDGPEPGYESVQIDINGGSIISFNAYSSYGGMDTFSLSAELNDNQFILTNSSGSGTDALTYNSNTTIYNIIPTTPVPLPAGIYLFLSGLVGLGLMRGRNG